MTKSLAIMGDVSDAMRNDMAQAARQVATSTKFSAEQAAESFFFLASAGLDAKASLAALPQVAASVNPWIIKAIWLHNNAAPIPVIKPFWDVFPA